MSDETLPVPPVVSAGPHRRRIGLAVDITRLARIVIAIALLAGGAALGAASFQAQQARQPITVTGDPATAGFAAPAVVQEFRDALASNDTDQVRAAVPGDPFEQLTKEMGTWSFSHITAVETLATYQDEGRTATELVIRGRNAEGGSILINLIVHAENGVITMFR